MRGLAVALAALVAAGGSGGAYYYFEVYKKKTPVVDASGANTATIQPVTIPASSTAPTPPTPPPAASVPTTSAAPTAVSYTTYLGKDFVVWSSDDVDLPGNPLNATFAQCEAACTSQQTCIGFSRKKSAMPGDASACYLKKKLSPQDPGNATWWTFTKP